MISDYKEETVKMQEKIDARIVIDRAKGVLIKKTLAIQKTKHTTTFVS